MTFLRRCFQSILSQWLQKASNFVICAFLLGINNNKSSIITSQYFLLCNLFKMVFIYVCQIGGETFNPIGILWYKYDALPKYGSIPQYFCDFSDSCKEWKASFKSNTDITSHLELSNNAKVSLNNGYTKLFFAILMFKCLKSVTTLLSKVIFWTNQHHRTQISWKPFLQYS